MLLHLAFLSFMLLDIAIMFHIVLNTSVRVRWIFSFQLTESIRVEILGRTRKLSHQKYK